MIFIELSLRKLILPIVKIGSIEYTQYFKYCYTTYYLCLYNYITLHYYISNMYEVVLSCAFIGTVIRSIRSILPFYKSSFKA